MNKASLKLLAIGGSNTFMLKGYIATLRGALEASGYPVEAIQNLALGANTCLMGLITLAAEPDIVPPDVVIIEYAVNDYSLIMSGQSDVWEAAYEGLVRQVSRRFPAALICCVVLGRSDSQEARWRVLSEGTRRISENYPNALIVDCPAELRSYFGDTELSEIYADPLHYGERARTAAGLLVASAIVAAPQPSEKPLPAPIHSDVLDPVSVIDFPTLHPEGKETFQNSVVKTDSLKVAAGGAVSVDLPGKLIAISFISRKDGGSFVMKMNGKTALVHTLHDQVESGNYPFLPLSAVGDWWKGPNEPGNLIIEPVAERSGPADWAVYHVGPSMEVRPPIYLHQLLVRAA